MDINNILTFLIVVILLVVSPGPNGFLIAKTVSLCGRKAGFFNIGGFIAAFYVHGTLSVLGVSMLLVQSAEAFFIFKMLGAVYLIWIGLKALLSALSSNEEVLLDVHHKSAKEISIHAAFLEGFLTNALNPKVSMFYLAAFPQFISTDGSGTDAYILVTLHAAANFFWFSIMVLMLSRFKSVKNTAWFKKWMSAMTGLVLIGFGSKLAFMKEA